MNLFDRLGELFIIGIYGSEIRDGSQLESDIKEKRPGGVILFDRSVARPEKGGNIKSPEQLTSLTACLHQLSPTNLLICVDQEGGMVQRLNNDNGFIDICSAEQMGADKTFELVRSEAVKNAHMLNKYGIDVNFAPVVDLNSNPANPVIGKVKRAFSADPQHVVHCANEWIRAHKKNNIISCLKHFPGHGSSTDDSHLGFVDISKSWHEKELLPYQNLIDENVVEMVMIGHLFNDRFDNKYPASLSGKTITGILRKQLHFDGCIVSDDLQMKAVSDHYGFDEAICKSLAAGVDMIILGNNLDHRPTILKDAIAAVANGLNAGIIDEARIYAALTRIHALKQKTGRT